MDSRYQHPQVAALWSTAWTYDAWWRIEQAVTRARLNLMLPESAADRMAAATLIANEVQPDFTDPEAIALVNEAEVITKHDVAAFLAFVREWWGEPHARWIHFGMTSSDLVDTAQGLRFKHMLPSLVPSLTELLAQTESWLNSGMVIAGRTHGQPAEPTALKVRAAHWVALLNPAVSTLISDTERMRIAKISGPVGTYARIQPEIEVGVASELGLTPLQFGGSQIAPRGPLARWANSVAELVYACGKIAMDVRLMTMVGEMRSFQSSGQVGSSSMAHKNNPIRAEQINGMQRLAAGYAAMLQPLDLWLERDISHSSVERVAVPDLWHVLMHTVEQTTRLLDETTLDPERISQNLMDSANALYTHQVTLAGIEDGMPYEEAREFGRTCDIESYALDQDMERDFLSDYPKYVY